MDAKSFLDDLLSTGKDLASKGQKIAEEKLRLPEDGEKRDVALDGMKKGAIAAGVLALLLGTSAGRRVTGSALKVGSLAAVGGIAWKAYQSWVSGKEDADQEVKDIAGQAKIFPINELNEEEANKRSLTLLKAMVAAAKADGHINNKEIAAIKEQMAKLALTNEVADLFNAELAKPLNVKDVAALAGNNAIAAEIYLVSAVITDQENSMEKDYLDALAKALKLPDELVAELQAIKEDELA